MRAPEIWCRAVCIETAMLISTITPQLRTRDIDASIRFYNVELCRQFIKTRVH